MTTYVTILAHADSSSSRGHTAGQRRYRRCYTRRGQSSGSFLFPPMNPLYDFSSLAVDRTLAPGDGMVAALTVGPSGARFTNQFVRSVKFVREEAEQRPVFRTFGTAFGPCKDDHSFVISAFK